MAETVGQRIRRLRREQGLSQRALSEGLDRVTYAYVSRVEAGTRTPSIRALIEMAGRLKTSALYLLEGTDDCPCPMCGRGPR
jgi:transcriptional regulator with XRE-family HTH domain